MRRIVLTLISLLLLLSISQVHAAGSNSFFEEATNGASSLNKQLLCASGAGNTVLVERLIEAGADVNFISSSGKWTPLHSAVQGGHQKVAEILISNGADINAELSDGITPLQIVVLEKDKDMIRLLINNKADVNISDKYETSPLSSAVICGEIEIATLLLENGAVIDPSLLMICEGDSDAVRLLTAYGACMDCDSEEDSNQGGKMDGTPVN